MAESGNIRCGLSHFRAIPLQSIRPLSFARRYHSIPLSFYRPVLFISVVTPVQAAAVVPTLLPWRWASIRADSRGGKPTSLPKVVHGFHASNPTQARPSSTWNERTHRGIHTHRRRHVHACTRGKRTLPRARARAHPLLWNNNRRMKMKENEKVIISGIF